MEDRTRYAIVKVDGTKEELIEIAHGANNAEIAIDRCVKALNKAEREKGVTIERRLSEWQK